MRALFKYLLNGLKYLVVQGIAEIGIVLVMVYLGINFEAMVYASTTGLFIENVQGVAWNIGMKTAVYGLFYVPLFAGISALLTWMNITDNLRYSVVNLFLSVLLFAVNSSLRDADHSEVSNLFIATILASVIIIMTVRMRENKER